VTIKLVQERLEGRPKPRHEPRLPFRDLAAEEEHNHPRAELGTTKAELETTKAELETTKAELKATKAELEATKRTLLRAEREAEKWRTAAMKVSAVVERAAKQISNVTEAVESDQEQLNFLSK
jgi:chromosome segregation ATPase